MGSLSYFLIQIRVPSATNRGFLEKQEDRELHKLRTLLHMNSSRMSTENLLGRNLMKASIDSSGIFTGGQQIEEPAYVSSYVLGCIPKLSQTRPQSHILFKNILWCSSMESNDPSICITYVVEHEKKVSIENIFVELQVSANTTKEDLVEYILKRAYGESRIKPSVLIVLNNHGGQGYALRLYKNEILPVLNAAHVDITYMETKYSKHGIDIGREADIDKYDIIACCSGDGVPHEIINGMYQRPDRARAFSKIAVTQLPCGSGNALSLSTHGSNLPGVAAFQMLKLTTSKLDLMAVTQGTGSQATTKLSFLSQAYGVIADSDIGTENLRWMGSIRFELGVTHKVWTKAQYPCDLYVSYATKSNRELQHHVTSHLKKGSSRSNAVTEDSFRLQYPPLEQAPPSTWEKVPSSITDKLNIFYVGNMPYMLNDAQFFPAALPDDGHMDLVLTETSTPFFTMAKILMSVDNGRHVHSDQVHHAKITAYRLVPRVKDALEHFISVDGENFPFEPLQVEVLPGLLTVMLQKGAFVETSFTGET